jgi:hypothetical protein
MDTGVWELELLFHQWISLLWKLDVSILFVQLASVAFVAFSLLIHLH